MPEAALPEGAPAPVPSAEGGGRRALVLALAALAGVLQVYGDAVEARLGALWPTAAVAALIVVGGPVLGIGGLYLFAVLLAAASRWLGGQASRAGLRAALAFAAVPVLVAGTAAALAQMAGEGGAAFRGGVAALPSAPRAFVGAFLAVILVFAGLWAIVRSVQRVAVVNGFSAARAAAALLLAGLMALVPIVLLGVAFGLALAASGLLARQLP